MSAGVVQYLESQKATHPELSDFFAQTIDLYQKKLWHQLTQKLEHFVNAVPTTQKEDLSQFYTRVVKDVELKLNPLTLVKICIAIARTYQDKNTALQFLQSIQEKVKADVQARILAGSTIAAMKLELGQVEETKKAIEAVKTDIEGVAGIDAEVYAAFYKVWADYYKRLNQPVDFYNNALKYIAYEQVESLPANKKMELAFDMAIAVLIGDSIYNFGELLGNDILKSLQGTPVEWIIQLLQIFNSGDIAAYEKLISTHKNELSQQQALIAHQNLLTQKISILALMELSFKRPSDKRTIAFEDVAQASKLPVNEVEHLLMKALSLKLVRGTIDEIQKTIVITWVQPRVLNLTQISGMRDRLGEWTKKVSTTLNYMEGEVAPEIFT